MQAELELVARARHTDPHTSHEAAASLTSDTLRASQFYVLSTFHQCGPLLDDASLVEQYAICVTVYGFPPQSESGLRTRRKELVTAGLVKAMGTTVLPSGRKAIVWGMAR